MPAILPERFQVGDGVVAAETIHYAEDLAVRGGAAGVVREVDGPRVRVAWDDVIGDPLVTMAVFLVRA